jgi:hypothetical protein
MQAEMTIGSCDGLPAMGWFQGNLGDMIADLAPKVLVAF